MKIGIPEIFSRQQFLKEYICISIKKKIIEICLAKRITLVNAFGSVFAPEFYTELGNSREGHKGTAVFVVQFLVSSEKIFICWGIHASFPGHSNPRNRN